MTKVGEKVVIATPNFECESSGEDEVESLADSSSEDEPVAKRPVATVREHMAIKKPRMTTIITPPADTNGHPNGHSNGNSNGNVTASAIVATPIEEDKDVKKKKSPAKTPILAFKPICLDNKQKTILAKNLTLVVHPTQKYCYFRVYTVNGRVRNITDREFLQNEMPLLLDELKIIFKEKSELPPNLNEVATHFLNNYTYEKCEEDLKAHRKKYPLNDHEKGKESKKKKKSSSDGSDEEHTVMFSSFEANCNEQHEWRMKMLKQFAKDHENCQIEDYIKFYNELSKI
jgi:hypothetical protein